MYNRTKSTNFGRNLAKMRKLLLLTLAVIISFSSTLIINGKGGAAANTFPDVSSIYANEVQFLIDRNVVTGYPDNTFRPDVEVTRGQAAAFISRALELDGEMRSTSFPDVLLTYQFSGYIESAVEKGIITGYPDGTFRPDVKVTRAEMAILLSRAFDWGENPDFTLKFTDVSLDTKAYESINQIASARVSTGYPDRTFRPNNPLKRIEFALFVARSMNEEFRPTIESIIASYYKEAVVINAPEGLNVRPEPSTRLAPIGKLPNGTAVKVFKIVAGNWAEIDYKGKIAYVHKDFLSTNQLAGKRIVIDPGHGGKDGGASANGIVEKNLVLDVSLILRDKLNATGATVIMTRSTDVFVELTDRAKIANDANANAFISIHANAAGETAHGLETFWNKRHESEESKLLAETIQKHLVETLKFRDRGAKERDLSVIRNTTMPSVLVELGFITNTAEAERMKQQSFKEDAATAILTGILEFYANK